MKEYKEMTQEIVDELAKTMEVDKFNIHTYNMYQRMCKDRGYYMMLTIDDDDAAVTLSIHRLDDDILMNTCLEGYWFNEILDSLPDVWHYVHRLPRGNVFDSVADCLYYLADEGYLCGGDSIEFIGDEEDEQEVVEIRTFGETHCLLSSYKIRH